MKTSTISLTAIEQKLLKLREETRELTEEIESDSPTAPFPTWAIALAGAGLGAAAMALTVSFI